MHAELIERLAAGATVVTPNRRLAMAVRHAFGVRALAEGQRAWRAPEVLPWAGWLEGTFRAASLSGHADRILIGVPQSRALWQRLISEAPEGQGLLHVAGAADAALAAWELAHAWRLLPALRSTPLTEECRAFLKWAQAYDAACIRGHLLDFARLPDAVRELVLAARFALPAELMVFGFDALTPQQQDLLDALREAGLRIAVLSPAGTPAPAVIVHHNSVANEIRAAALWARGHLSKNPNTRIGIVVPELTRLRPAIARIFDEMLVPSAMLEPGRLSARPWNVSLGLPLARWPLVHAALSVLEFACGSVRTELAGALLRSPFIGGAESERTARALLDARLRRIGDPRLTLDGLLHQAGTEGHSHSCGLLAERLAALRYRLRELPLQPQPMSFWGQALGSLLAGLGWPGERELSSEEYQTLVRWNDTVAGLAQLDMVLGPTTLAGAVGVLRAQMSDLLFQPESREVPIQVMGTLESAQIEFDHLLVLGLTDEAWPRVARPNPLLPIALQRARGLPRSSAEWELGFARRLQAGWRNAAASVVFSYHHADGDRTLAPSPLLAGIPVATSEELEMEPQPDWRSVVLVAAAIEHIVDWQGRALPDGMLFAGGARVLQDQSACAFRAFAAHRLGAKALEHPHEGLDASDRGTLLHTALAALWSELATQQRLIDAAPSDVFALVERCVAHALARLRRRRASVLQARFLELERERLTKLVFEWLEVEHMRQPFDVVATEHATDLNLGGVALRLRMDRIDRLTSGDELLLDYKTGSVSPNAWLGERPDEPQLLLYALARPIPAALAFAQVRRGECKLAGVSGGVPVGPGVAALSGNAGSGKRDWSAQLAAWRTVVEQLAVAFRCGAAPVDPKHRTETCRMCDLSSLCRVSELADRGSPTVGEDDERN